MSARFWNAIDVIGRFQTLWSIVTAVLAAGGVTFAGWGDVHPILLIPIAIMVGATVLLAWDFVLRRRAPTAAPVPAPPPAPVRVETIGQTHLHLLFDTSNATYAHDLARRHELGRGGRMYRVGVRNGGSVTAYGVSLRLVAAQPGATGLPAAFRRMHDRSVPPRTSWTLAPGDTAHFDVVSMPFQLLGIHQEQLASLEPHMHVHFADPVFPWMPVRPCALVLEARADNVPIPARGSLEIGPPVREGEAVRVEVGFVVHATASG